MGSRRAVQRSRFAQLVLGSVVLTAAANVASATPSDAKAKHADPVGLSLFFRDGVAAPINLVGDAPRFLQEIDITASVTTSTDQGIQPLIQSSQMANLDWRGVHFV